MSDFAWTFSNCAINVVDATLTVLLPYIVVKQSKIKWDVYIAIAFLTFMSSVCNIFDVGPIGNYIFYFMAFATTLLLIRQKPLAVIAWTAIFLIAQIVIDVAVNPGGNCEALDGLIHRWRTLYIPPRVFCPRRLE